LISVTKTPPAAVLLKKAAGVEKGSGDTKLKLKLQQLLVRKYKKLLKLKCLT
jgi:ribosomal protein L11